jgi:hypothetical protein
VEYVPYFMANLEWHRSVGYADQLICHVLRSNIFTCLGHGGICEEQSSSSINSYPR